MWHTAAASRHSREGCCAAATTLNGCLPGLAAAGRSTLPALIGTVSTTVQVTAMREKHGLILQKSTIHAPAMDDVC